MILENLKDFEWYNEPENVVFSGHDMQIAAAPETDFWQSRQHGFSKDNGHFFYKRLEGDFCCIVKWRFTAADLFKQCGLMIRIDERNWFKMSVMSEVSHKAEAATCLTNCGYTDWASVPLSSVAGSIWFKLVRQGNDFASWYSMDGKTFCRLRQFYLINIQPELKVGAYICSPQNESFQAILDNVDFS